MKLLTETQREQLPANDRNRDGGHPPVVKLFDPAGAASRIVEFGPELEAAAIRRNDTAHA